MVMGGLAVIGVIIVAMAISANDTAGKIIQYGLVIAIIVLLIRNVETGGGTIFSAWNNLTRQAIGTTGKQTSS